eukprot:scaffold6600_cov125-Isochrysis_galbana.AAC.14
MAQWELECTWSNVPCNVEIKTPHYDHTTRAHRHTVPGHLPPPVRLGLGGQRRLGGFRFCPRTRVEARSTSHPTSLLPAAAGVRSPAPPAGTCALDNISVVSDWFSGHSGAIVVAL